MSVNGRHRHPATMPVASLLALIAALGGAGAMLSVAPPKPPSAVGAEPLVAEEYPNRKLVDLPGKLADGASYTPLFFVDGQRSLGTALTPDGRSIRLLLREQNTERELRRLPKEQAPDFAGFVADGKSLAWVELTAGADGQGDTRIWSADLAGGVARTVTTDTGDVMLFDKQDDMVLHDGRLSWMTAGADEGQSALRSVALTGGKVQVETLEGGFALSAWPWLVSEATADAGTVELRNMETTERTVVGVQTGELMTCSPTWCRSVIIGSTESSTVIELMHPDGKNRIRTISGSVASAIVDVAVLDRYEVYSRSGAAGNLRNTQVLIYDLKTSRLSLAAESVGQVVCRNGVLWWSTGDNETLAWHVLDLRTLG